METDPAIIPMRREIPAFATNPAGAPIATAPAKVAFNISSIQNFYRRRALRIKVAKQLPVNEMMVLLTMRER